jgi:hypothetical protein
MRTARLAAATAAALLLTLTACSSAGGGSTADTASRAGAGGSVALQDAGGAAEAPSSASGGKDSVARNAADTSGDLVEQQALIKTGAVSLRSDDVGQTRFDVQALVDQHDGEVSDDRTETDKTGAPLRSRMVLRVPAGEFDAVMSGLAKAAQLVSTTSSSEDVTTQLIDVNARIKAQQDSVDRVRQLLARAQSIRDIMAIESELSQRQADLDSLTQQQAYLKDQTSLSTIRVSIERKPALAVVHHHSTRTGFLAGLGNGWDGLQNATVAVLTVVGALLPFAIVLALLGVPAWLLVRRFRRQAAPLPAPRADATA